jgi:uncharacterized membrane protein
VLITLRVPAHAIRTAIQWQIVAVMSLMAGATAAFGWLLIAQHRALHSRAYDLGYFDQVIWNTAHGRWFQTNFVEFNFLGEHFAPVLLVFAALYRLGGDVELVLALQAAAVGLAVLPLFRATVGLLHSATAGTLICVAYLFSPHLHEAVLSDFHPELFGIPIVFSAFALLVAQRPGAAVAAVSSLALLKEDAVLVGIGFAWLLWWRGERRYALALLGMAVVYAVAVMGLLMPHLRGDAPGLMGRYGYLGDSLLGIVRGAVTRPDVVWAQLSDDVPRRAVTHLLLATAGLPLLSPATLAALPVTVPNLLSAHGAQAGLGGHYATYPLSLTLLSALYAMRWLAHSPHLERVWLVMQLRPAVRPVLLASVLAGAQAAAWWAWSPLDHRLDPATYRVTPHTDVVQRVIAMIPADGRVSAQSNLLPHLSQRQWVKDYPRLDGVEYVILDFNTWGMWQTSFPIYERVLNSLPGHGFCHIYEEDGVHLYRHLPSCPGNPNHRGAG